MLVTMATSEERKIANLARIKEIMEKIENTTNDLDLLVELNRLINKQYSLSLKWHTIVFKSEIDSSLLRLENIRRKEIEIANKRRRSRKEPKEGLKEVYYDSSEIPNAFKLDYCLVYDAEKNQYKWLKYNRSEREDIFVIPKSMIGEYSLKWSEDVKQKWGEDKIGQAELLERSLCN